MHEVAIDKLLEVTENPRHRFLLQAFSRHRYLEVAGRYEEIFAPDMMSDNPVYHMHADRIKMNLTLEGQEQVKSLYRTWVETNQSIFYVENEEVADHFIATVSPVHQQVWGKALTANKMLSYLPYVIFDRILDKMLNAKGLNQS